MNNNIEEYKVKFLTFWYKFGFISHVWLDELCFFSKF